MLPEPGIFFALVLLGIWVGIDSTSVGQFMISRPVVSASVAGWIAGDPAAGALIGLILEGLNLTVLPVGAARYPEIGPASVVTGALFALSPQDTPAAVSGIVFAIAWAWIAGLTVRYMRQYNCRLIAPISNGAEPGGDGLPRMLQLRHLAGIGVDVLRSALLVAIGIPTLYLLQSVTRDGWGLPESVSSVVVWAAAQAVVTPQGASSCLDRMTLPIPVTASTLPGLKTRGGGTTSRISGTSARASRIRLI
jgi:hypothetical protein